MSSGLLFASYPRSGSTRAREIVSAAVNLQRAALGLPAKKATDIVENAEADRPADAVPAFARTHSSSGHRGMRTAFLFRDPIDSIYSYYCFLHRNRPEERDGRKFSSRVLRLSESWVTFYVLALEAELEHAPRFMSYQRSMDDPEGAFSELLTWVGREDLVPFLRPGVEVAEGRFRRTPGFQPTALQPNRGGSGGHEMLPEPLKEKIWEATHVVYDALLAREGK